MFHRVRVTAAGVALAGATAVSIAIAPTASAAPVTPVAAPALTFNLPATGVLNIGPAAVPGSGLFPQTFVTARPAAGSSVTFAVPNPGPYHFQYPYRYVQVSWRNVATGASGTLDLRHWQLPNFAPHDPGYTHTLPTSATANTGAGPVVATVTVLREQYEGPPRPITIIPGLNALLVP